jgi:hypothetical protein
MKFSYRFMLLAFLATVIFCPAQRAGAQDTLVVEWADAGGNVIVNALRDAILNDTNRPAGRVYKLKRGGYYHNSDRIENPGFHLRIVGEPGGPTEFDNPPVLQMVSRLDGSNDGRLITGLSSITLKNLYIPGANQDGTQTWYEPITTNASNSRFYLDNVIFERSNFSMTSFYGTDNDIFIKNCKFRNLIGEPSSQQWEGRGTSMWADQDTVIVENCTYFNVGMTAFQLEGGAASYVLFVHNTLVNVGRAIHSGNWWREAYFANNLLVNTFWHGEGLADVSNPGRNPRAYTAGMFSIGALPSIYGPEQGRRIVLANTAAWRDPAFATFYADSIRAQPFINPITKEDYIDVYDAMVAVDTTWLANRPNTPTYFSASFIDSMIHNINDLRRGIIPASPYFWRLPVFNGDRCHVCVNWPLPENFSYDDANLLTAGTDGLPLGDLNWFPAQKAQWEANKAQYISQVQALAGERLDVVIEGSAEAENGTLGGDAKVEPYGGATPYFHMEGGGLIQWKFNMPQAGTVELKIVTRSQDARRGQHVRVNGVGLRNDAGFGEYSWYDLDPVQWKEYTIRQADLVAGATALNLQAGENTIEIAPSWGYQEFQSVTVVLGGVDIAVLDATNTSDLQIVTLITPVVLPWFHMEGGGFMRWTFTMAEAATVEIRITTRSQDARRGQHVRVNGTGLRNDAGFGEYSWYDLHPTEWKAYTIRQADLIAGADALNLQAGENTIEIAQSWGYQEFLQVEVLVNGAVVHDLNATNVTEFSVVTIESPGGLPPPSGFKSVLIGTSGSITWTFNVAEAGNYRLNVFYHTPDVAQPGSVEVGGATVATFQYTGAPGEELWRSVLTGKFALSAGPQAITLTGSNVYIDFAQFLHDITVTSVDKERVPHGFSLHQNYPNPFNPTTTINFSLGKPSKVKLTVYNLLGQKVATVIDRPMNAGQHAVVFDAKSYGSGIYFYQLEAGEFKSHRRMMLIK